MSKKRIYIISVLFLLLFVVLLSKNEKDNDKKVASNNDFKEEADQFYDDEAETDQENNNSKSERTEAIRIKDITSLEDITDDMILQQMVGYNTIFYSSNYSDNWFEISVSSYTGCDYSQIIHTEKETEVTIHYTTTMEKNTLKMGLIVGDELITLPEDQQELTYTLPKGDTIIALSCYKAGGKIEMNIDAPNDTVKIIQATE